MHRYVPGPLGGLPQYAPALGFPPHTGLPGNTPPPPPPPPQTVPALPIVTFPQLYKRSRSVCGAIMFDMIRSIGMLASFPSTAIYKAGVLSQRAAQNIVESMPLDESNLPRPSAPTVSTCPDAPSVRLMQDLSSYSSLFQLVLGIEQGTDDSLIFLAAACLLVVWKIECPHQRIRTLTHAVERLIFRRRIKLGVPAPNGAPRDLAEVLKPKVLAATEYDCWKAQILCAEQQLLPLIGFGLNVELPHFFAVHFLRLMLDCEGDEGMTNFVFRSWLEGAIRWLNDVPRHDGLVTLDPPVLACAALNLTRPFEAATELPADWSLAFGVTLKEAEGCAATMLELQRTIESSQSALTLLANQIGLLFTRLDEAARRQQETDAFAKKAQEVSDAVVACRAIPIAPMVPAPPPASLPIDVLALEDISCSKKPKREKSKEKKKDKEKKIKDAAAEGEHVEKGTRKRSNSAESVDSRHKSVVSTEKGASRRHDGGGPRESRRSTSPRERKGARRDDSRDDKRRGDHQREYRRDERTDERRDDKRRSDRRDDYRDDRRDDRRDRHREPSRGRYARDDSRDRRRGGSRQRRRTPEKGRKRSRSRSNDSRRDRRRL